MEGQATAPPPPNRNGPPYLKRHPKRKQPQHSADIVFSKGASIHTMPSLSKQLKGITDSIIGLQYVWEYRSPSKSVPPHYQCKLCSMSRLQHDMLDHIKGWKHSFRFMKKVYPEMVSCSEEDAIKDPLVRMTIKEAAAEVERTKGRGQIKVILKEPSDVVAFKGLRSAFPRRGPPGPGGPGMGPMGPPFGPRFSNSRFPGDFPPHGGPPSNHPLDEYREPGFGGYPTIPDFPDSGVNPAPFSDQMGRSPGAGSGNGFGPGRGRDGYGRSGLLDESPRKMFPDGYRGSPMESGLMNRPIDKPQDRPGLMGPAPESRSLPNTLLAYLDSFQIENESDAQLVLKVTQKLTDVLMEYRLRSIPGGSSLNSMSMSSTNFLSSPTRPSGSSDRFSSSFSGPSRYSDGPPRY